MDTKPTAAYNPKTVKIRSGENYLNSAKRAFERSKYRLAENLLLKADLSYQGYGNKAGSEKTDFLKIAIDLLKSSKNSSKLGDYKGAQQDLDMALKKFQAAGYGYGESFVKEEITHVKSLAANQSQRIRESVRERLEKLSE